MSTVLFKQYDPVVLKKLQGVQTQMLKDVLDVCEKQDLPCFLIYGTAIGAVRHKGFIPWMMILMLECFVKIMID